MVEPGVWWSLGYGGASKGAGELLYLSSGPKYLAESDKQIMDHTLAHLNRDFAWATHAAQKKRSSQIPTFVSRTKNTIQALKKLEGEDMGLDWPERCFMWDLGCLRDSSRRERAKQRVGSPFVYSHLLEVGELRELRELINYSAEEGQFAE